MSSPPMSALHSSGRAQRLLSLAVRVAAVAPMLVDVTTGRPVAAPEYEYVALVLLHPLALRAGGVRPDLSITAWVSGTILLHQAGIVYGLYAIPWWDHLTHLASATLVAGLGYTLLKAAGRRTTAGLSPRALVAGTLVVLLLASGVWEVYERVTPDLQTYGLEDTAADLLFNLLGGALVLLLGRGRLDAAAARLARRSRVIDREPSVASRGATDD